MIRLVDRFEDLRNAGEKLRVSELAICDSSVWLDRASASQRSRVPTPAGSGTRNGGPTCRVSRAGDRISGPPPTLGSAMPRAEYTRHSISSLSVRSEATAASRSLSRVFSGRRKVQFRLIPFVGSFGGRPRPRTSCDASRDLDFIIAFHAV